MSNAILIIGDSGSGKSTAIRNLPPEETFWINVDRKDLPFKAWKNKFKAVIENGKVDRSKTNYVETNSPDKSPLRSPLKSPVRKNSSLL